MGRLHLTRPQSCEARDAVVVLYSKFSRKCQMFMMFVNTTTLAASLLYIVHGVDLLSHLALSPFTRP